jgi:alpha-L-fucosidase
MKLFNKSKLIIIPAILLSAVVSNAQTIAPKPYGAVPSARQLKWQETEMYCIIHFTPTTFQNKEWGYGDADPSIFNPSRFSADQIVAAAKSGGFKGIVYVAKHHDGFALWPTKTSKYNISESPWKNGKGDMVKEFQMAARQAGMKFGIYCSPWDRSNTSYGTPEYVNVYRRQITELYSNYGDLFMSWHDGANGGDGFYGGKNEKRKVDQSSYYDWMNTWAITRKLQPNASIFSDIGLDVRWVGNEKGLAPETSWSTITIKGKEGKAPMPGYMDDENLGSGTRGGEKWIPFEGDVALRPGWFYHPEQDNELKTTAQLFHIYCNSVGRGGALDLGLSPTTEGILHQNDVAALAAFGKYLKEVFAVDLAKEATITATNVRAEQQKIYGTANLTDADRYSYWATDDQVHQATVNLAFKQPLRFSIIRLRENIKLGQRIDSVEVEAFKDNQWVKIAKATSIGANRIIRLSTEETAAKIRVRLYAPVSIALSEVALFLEPKITEATAARTENVYDKTSWKVINDSSAITIDMGKTSSVSALSYLPEQDKSSAGAIQKYDLQISEDGHSWKSISSGEFSNIAANPILQRIALPQNISTRYIKLISNQSVPGNGGKVQLGIAQIEVYK